MLSICSKWYWFSVYSSSNMLPFYFIYLANTQCLLYAKHYSSYWGYLSSWSLHSEKIEWWQGRGPVRQLLIIVFNKEWLGTASLRRRHDLRESTMWQYMVRTFQAEGTSRETSRWEGYAWLVWGRAEDMSVARTVSRGESGRRWRFVWAMVRHSGSSSRQSGKAVEYFDETGSDCF